METLSHSSNDSTRQPLSLGDWVVLAIVGLTPLVFSFFELLPANTWKHPPFHAVVEGLGSFAAVIVAAAMVMLLQQGDLPRAYVWVISGLLAMGLLDGLHAATHAGHVFVWLHSTATFLGGLLFAAIWIPQPINRRLDGFAIAAVTSAVVTIFGVGSILRPDWLPAMKDDTGFTWLAKSLNVGGGIGFLAAAAYFVRQGKKQESVMFACHCLLFGVAGIIFEQSVLWDSNWWLWHILRLIAYTVLLYYFMTIYYRTLINLSVVRLSLEQRIADVSRQTTETQRAREQLETILDSTADAIISVDQSAAIRLFNSRAEELFGYERDQVLGEPVSKLFTSAARDEHQRLLLSFRDGAAPQVGQEHKLQAQRSTGDNFPVALRITEMQYGDEQLYVELLQDVTQRQQAEEDRKRLFDAVRETVNHLSTASEEIAATMATQTDGASRQADVVNDTMNAVEETAVVAKESAEIANEVAETARIADDVGRSGREALEETRQSMDTLQTHVESTAENILTLAERAQAIGEIITAVNDIAEQTNVLALNAAVEASRAGEAGRGFAVVAAEVKSLAEQAKKATQQVRNILSEIQQATTKAVVSTENGTKSVSEANRVVANAEQTIDELGQMVSAAAQLASKIVAASSRQSSSMNRITDSMNEIDQAAKRSRIATGQTMQSAADLDALGKKLKSLIEQGRARV